ncbi:MAG: Gfo/Idh/MocA family oxidoreductase [Caldilineaceae bacterium]|nr:Gfo/Idh/MocA family oxidoreductase [Caldilineaceae bacterium]
MKLPARVGLVGCGIISTRYIEVSRELPEFDIKACADAVPSAAKAQAEKFGLQALSPEDLYGAPDIDMVLNLTPPPAHFSVGKAALEAGKAVYSEKPLAATFAEGKELMALANKKNLRIGCAPDTILGAGYQSARLYLDEGTVGAPVAATAFMMSRGHEYWHANPAFFYKPGGGPMLDMGVYYLTALVHLLGPVTRVTGTARATWSERTVYSEPRKGEVIEVEVPTYVAGLLDFECGAIGTIITTFDTQASALPRIELYGETGTLNLPDPNTFGGPLQVRTHADRSWKDLPLRFGHAGNSRGIGPADMVVSTVEDGLHRANGEVALHVLEIMESIHVASETGSHVELSTHCERPRLLPEGVYAGVRPD